MIKAYLEKHAFTNKLISEPPSSKLGLIVVIPAYDELDLIPSMKSLISCKRPEATTEIIVVFNAGELSEKSVFERNRIAKQKLTEWYLQHQQSWYTLHIIEQNNLPQKHAGVGLARKIGMDEAARRFNLVGHPSGVIICFDSDSFCESNYLSEIEKHFKKFPKIAACSICFEHPTNGLDFDAQIYKGIACYEMHLRYYKNALAYAGMPFAFHTIGSSMAVRAKDYCKEGGMNRRKAGEDFYFLQKFIANNELNELNSTTVYPSPRPSLRVPFGTGRAIHEMLNEERQIEFTYAYEIFNVMKASFKDAQNWFKETPKFHPQLIAFYGEEKLHEKVHEIKGQSADAVKFRKRLFQWFNAFQALKFVHFLRDHCFENQLLSEEVPKLLDGLNVDSTVNLLQQLRKIDRNQT